MKISCTVWRLVLPPRVLLLHSPRLVSSYLTSPHLITSKLTSLAPSSAANVCRNCSIWWCLLCSPLICRISASSSCAHPPERTFAAVAAVTFFSGTLCLELSASTELGRFVFVFVWYLLIFLNFSILIIVIPIIKCFLQVAIGTASTTSS